MLFNNFEHILAFLHVTFFMDSYIKFRAGFYTSEPGAAFAS